MGVYASQRFAWRIAAIDLQPPQFRVLNAVDAVEGQSQGAIGEAIGAPASRMVAIVDELAARAASSRGVADQPDSATNSPTIAP